MTTTILMCNREGRLPTNVSRLRLLLPVSGTWGRPQEEIGYWWKDLFTTHIGGFDMGQGNVHLAMKTVKRSKSHKAKKAQPRTLEYGQLQAKGTDKKNANSLTIKMVQAEEWWEDIVVAHVCVTQPKTTLETCTGQMLWAAHQARIRFRHLACAAFSSKQAITFADIVKRTFAEVPETIAQAFVEGEG